MSGQLRLQASRFVFALQNWRHHAPLPCFATSTSWDGRTEACTQRRPLVIVNAVPPSQPVSNLS